MAQFSKAKVFLLVLLSFIIGIGFAGFIRLGSLLLYYLALTAVLLCFLGADKRIKIFGLLIFFFVLGNLRWQLAEPKMAADKIYFYNGQKIAFIGQIVVEPDQRSDRTYLTMAAKQFQQQKISGKVLVPVSLYADYHYGQWLEIQCRLDEPINTGNFNYHEYLARYDIYSLCRYPKIKIIEQRPLILTQRFYQVVLSLKNKFKSLIAQNFTEPQGSFFSALTLGLQRDIPPAVQNWFRLTGTSHIIAISGMHIAIMVQLIEVLALSVLCFSRSRAFYFSAGLISLYLVLIGMPASAVRSAIMGLAILYAKKIGRPTQSINLIVLTAALMLFQNPRLLKSDVGFQLSFLAVIGMVFAGDYFYQLFKKIPEWRYLPLRYSLATTLSAQVFTLPLVLYYFGNLSLSAPLANLLVLFVLPLLMMVGFAFLLVGLIWSMAAKIIAFPVWLLLTYILLVLKLFASVPYLSYSFGPIHWTYLIGLYGLIIFIWLKIRKKKILKSN
jgi:competence protein ComEC